MTIHGWMAVATLFIGPHALPCYGTDTDSTRVAPRWQQKEYRILPHSVCYNYRVGSIDYRRCRVLAKQQFKQRCRSYGDKVKNTQYPYNAAYQRKQQMYCTAARTFNPLNL
ncbi:hypothetical protein [Aestuariirhabdus sp. LZHN29]|uniref:hypothetical protein n=1 Tax=Aestuariirhabdus sp. LZHN29 TaxID=3417462 RepID=UPI003CE6D64A